VRHILAISSETFVLLRRDRIFIPALTIMFLICYFAGVAGYWSIETYRKLIFDVLAAGFHLTGALIAIFWGTKLVADARKEGTTELQLAAPIKRSHWIIGKFLGLAAILVFIGMILVVISQAMLLYQDVGWMGLDELAMFGLIVCSWLVLAALAILFSTIAGYTTAMFSVFGMWIIGLTIRNISFALHRDTPELIKKSVMQISRVWDLQRFNVVEQITSQTPLVYKDLQWSFSYGFILCLIMLTLACLAINKKDMA